MGSNEITKKRLAPHRDATWSNPGELPPISSVRRDRSGSGPGNEHELPNRQQLQQIARGVATETGELTQGRVDRAAPGLGKRALPLGRRDGALPTHRQYLEPPPRQPRAVGELRLQSKFRNLILRLLKPRGFTVSNHT